MFHVDGGVLAFLSAVGIVPLAYILLWIWDRFFNPHRCICNAADWLQFGIFVEHAKDCPARTSQ